MSAMTVPQHLLKLGRYESVEAKQKKRCDYQNLEFLHRSAKHQQYNNGSMYQAATGK
jgi:hypothetical protein